MVWRCRKLAEVDLRVMARQVGPQEHNPEHSHALQSARSRRGRTWRIPSGTAGFGLRPRPHIKMQPTPCHGAMQESALQTYGVHIRVCANTILLLCTLGSKMTTAIRIAVWLLGVGTSGSDPQSEKGRNARKTPDCDKLTLDLRLVEVGQMSNIGRD